MAFYTLFFISISLLVYNSLGDRPPTCANLQVKLDECQKAGRKIYYTSDNLLSPGDTNVAVSSGTCLVQVTSSNPTAVTKKILDQAITDFMKACPQGGSIEKDNFKLVIDEVKTDDRLYGPNAPPHQQIVCTNEKPVYMVDCFGAALAIPSDTSKNPIVLTQSGDKGIINSAGTCTIQVSARAGQAIYMDKDTLLKLVASTQDIKYDVSLVEKCRIQNSNKTMPAYMIQSGGVYGLNGVILIQTLFNKSGKNGS